jgi:ATP-dependent protease Clp ATPase subunit
MRCSLCGKSSAEVETLITGPGVYICDERVALCNEIIEEGRAPTQEPRNRQAWRLACRGPACRSGRGVLALRYG